MKETTTRILLVDDHRLFRNALSVLISSFSFKTTILQAENGQEAIDILLKEPVDIVLLDVQMPVLGGVETMKIISSLNLKCKVIILTQFREDSLISHLVELGARGVLRKNCSSDELQDSILQVIKSDYYYNEAVLKVIQENISKTKHLANLKLSARELQILTLLKEGRSNKEIAADLKLSQHTAESYRKSLMKKTRCKSAAEIVSFAYKTGFATD